MPTITIESTESCPLTPNEVLIVTALAQQHVTLLLDFRRMLSLPPSAVADEAIGQDWLDFLARAFPGLKVRVRPDAARAELSADDP